MMADPVTEGSSKFGGGGLTSGCAGGEGRTLRRRRSAASAALLSRPSMLTIGELVPTYETCVLVYATSSSISGTLSLVYALFEPSFLVDGASGSVRRLDRASWERLRSHVEELRIVALASRYGDAPLSSPSAPSAPSSAREPQVEAPVRKPDCVFDLFTPTDPPASERAVGHIYLQPQSYTAVPARSKDELLEIEIHAPSNAAAAEARRVCLPTQVRAVLHDAEQLLLCDNASPPPSSAPHHPGQQRPTPPCQQPDYASACKSILQLVQSRPPPPA